MIDQDIDIGRLRTHCVRIVYALKIGIDREGYRGMERDGYRAGDREREIEID